MTADSAPPDLATVLAEALPALRQFLDDCFCEEVGQTPRALRIFALATYLDDIEVAALRDGPRSPA